MKNLTFVAQFNNTRKLNKRIQSNDVILMEGNGNYTWVYLANGTKILYSKTMNCMTEEFKTNDFLRIHKSFTINLNHIKYRDESNEMTFVLTNGLRAEVSRRKKKELIDFINLYEIK